MARFTTIVAVIGPEAGALVSAVADDAANVGAVHLNSIESDDEQVRRRTAWNAAQRRKTTYTLIDFDPMRPVVDAWRDRLTGGAGELSLQVGLVDGDVLPDYLLVTDDVDDETVHWYHGLLRGFAPRRVVAVHATPESISGALRTLRSDQSFPKPSIVGRAALDYVPTELSGRDVVLEASRSL